MTFKTPALASDPIPTLSNPTPSSRLCPYRLPQIIRVEEFRKLGIDIHHMHIPLLRVPNDRFVVVACLVRLDVDTQRSVDLELQSMPHPPTLSALALFLQPPPPLGAGLYNSHGSIIHLPLPPRLIIPLHPLSLQIRQARLQHLQLPLQPLTLNLDLGSSLRDPEFLRVQFADLGRMAHAVMRGDGLFVLGGEGGEVAGEFAEGVFGIADAEVAGLLEGGEGFVDAAQGEFIGLDVEVGDCVVD